MKNARKIPYRIKPANFDSTINVRAKSSHLGVPEDVGGAHREKAKVGVRGQAVLPRSVDAP